MGVILLGIEYCGVDGDVGDIRGTILLIEERFVRATFSNDIINNEFLSAIDTEVRSYVEKIDDPRRRRGLKGNLEQNKIIVREFVKSKGMCI